MNNSCNFLLGHKGHLSPTLLRQQLKKLCQCNKKIKDYLLTQKSSKSRYFVLSLAQRVSNKKILKTELRNGVHQQSLNLRLKKSEQKLNQFAEITESLFLKNHANNDPMDVEPQVPILNKNENKKIIKFWLCKRFGHLVKKMLKIFKKVII